MALGFFAPLRGGLVLFGVESDPYCDRPLIFCAYHLTLGALVASAGWGILRRRRWGPLVGGLGAGAAIALGSASLVTSFYVHLGSHPGHLNPETVWQFFTNGWRFQVLNSALVAGGVAALSSLLRAHVRREFPYPAASPAALIGAALMSAGVCLGVTGYVWVRFVLQ